MFVDVSTAYFLLTFRLTLINLAIANWLRGSIAINRSHDATRNTHPHTHRTHIAAPLIHETIGEWYVIIHAIRSRSQSSHHSWRSWSEMSFLIFTVVLHDRWHPIGYRIFVPNKRNKCNSLVALRRNDFRTTDVCVCVPFLACGHLCRLLRCKSCISAYFPSRMSASKSEWIWMTVCGGAMMAIRH